ncbi:hypothetical protein FB45DRAFT_353891 [Roridomyces roridus]|uniref:F-box domain-containing protein n=1 Tax=Roridomyces roridus TaxID=1738132 RepID=A0AAD7C7G4_9AGAR|nr:hypothetical protein FB45DRAFT_353891 [Roridomyces roridus]
MELFPCQQRLDAYKYPVLTLPNELTSEIFDHFLPRYPDCPPLSGLKSPTILTYICRKWREIALANPKLWRAFSTDYTSSSKHLKQAEQIRAVRTWLERSGFHPLSIQLAISYINEAPNEAFVAILLHRQRWQHVHLDLAAEEVDLIKGPMPLLESLTIEVDGMDYTHPVTTANDFPRLRAVTLDNADHWNWLPISQLTSLTFEDVEPASYLPALLSAVNLIRLNLVDCYPDVASQGSIVLHRLKTLVVVKSHPSNISQILEMFTLPALRTLHISAELLGQDPSSSLTPLITRSGCQLQEVLIAGASDFSEESFRAAFPSIPNITFDGRYSWYTKARRLRDTF